MDNFILGTDEKLKLIMQHKDLQFTLWSTVHKIFNKRKRFL